MRVSDATIFKKIGMAMYNGKLLPHEAAKCVQAKLIADKKWPQTAQKKTSKPRRLPTIATTFYGRQRPLDPSKPRCFHWPYVGIKLREQG